MSAVRFGWEADMDNVAVLVDKDASILDPKARPLAAMASTFGAAKAARCLNARQIADLTWTRGERKGKHPTNDA